MNFISLASGIEAASVAFKPLGWKAVSLSEIDHFACIVKAETHHGFVHGGGAVFGVVAAPVP